MLKVIREDVGAYYQHYPRAATIVTSQHDGRKNAMAVAWHSPVSFKPPLYGISISPKRYSYALITQSGQFGVNFMHYNDTEIIAAVGGSNGSTMDKFTEFNLDEDTAVKTGVPILCDAYTVYECRVTDNRVYGDHAWIIGEIVAVHVAEEVLTDKGVFSLETIKPALYLGADYYCNPDKLSLRFVDREKYGKR